MIKIKRKYKYVGNDINLKNMECNVIEIYKESALMMFDDLYLGKMEIVVPKKQLFPMDKYS